MTHNSMHFNCANEYITILLVCSKYIAIDTCDVLRNVPCTFTISIKFLRSEPHYTSV